MEKDATESWVELTKALPVNPLIAALLTHPAVINASRRAVAELSPVVGRSLKGLRVGALTLNPWLLTSCFAAGVAVGWLTAPAKGSELRAGAKARIQSWVAGAEQRARSGAQLLTRRISRRGNTHSDAEAPS